VSSGEDTFLSGGLLQQINHFEGHPLAYFALKILQGNTAQENRFESSITKQIFTKLKLSLPNTKLPLLKESTTISAPT
jgi:hypothetical protein